MMFTVHNLMCTVSYSTSRPTCNSSHRPLLLFTVYFIYGMYHILNDHFTVTASKPLCAMDNCVKTQS